ncbi:hypothetical protein BG011_008289 [Mortierella polycephala]|uniref:Uncharacterized protein n=1 Tax=Mortierella polycephala TaxID=41804 RepID=A0A9P6PRD2_9FUNG|nr:hypothetical protein BG011_008289 [Mortierella polycephala]
MVPKPTTISGKVTTIYVPETTTSPVPTIIQDPAQEPPPGTRVEEHDQRGREGLAAWKITLIIVACFVVVLAVGAAIFVGRIKKRRRRRDKQEGGLQQQRSEGMFGVYESDLGSKDGKHNTTPEAVSARAFKSDKRGGGWRSKLRVRMPWDEPVMHRDAHLQGQPRQGPSGLWLMEDDGLNGHEEMIAAAAMYPVSYQNVSQPEIGLQPRQRPESGHGQDLMSQEQFLQHGHLRDSSRISYPPTPLPTPLPTPSSFTFPASASIQKGISSTTFASAKTTNSLAAPTLPGPFLEGRISTSTDYADGHGFGHEQRPGNYELNILASALESQRASLVLEFDTANNSGNETPAKRNTIIVDVDQLESNTKFEHVRQGPQAILGSPNSQTTQINTEQQLQKGDEDGCVGNAEAGPSSINKSRNSLSEKDTAAATVNVGSNPIVEK